MPWVRRSTPGNGHWVIALSAAAALAVAIATYRAPDVQAAARTPAALLICGWCAALLGAGFALPAVRGDHPGVHMVFAATTLLGILGVAVAAFLLRDFFILASMAVCLSGLVHHLVVPRIGPHYRRIRHGS